MGQITGRFLGWFAAGMGLVWGLFWGGAYAEAGRFPGQQFAAERAGRGGGCVFWWFFVGEAVRRRCVLLLQVSPVRSANHEDSAVFGVGPMLTAVAGLCRWDDSPGKSGLPAVVVVFAHQPWLAVSNFR